MTVIAADGEVPPQGVFDALIVDEGQDLLNFETLDRLERALRGGLVGGCWRMFYDANKQTGLVGRYDPQAVELLISYGGIPTTLRMNCRNTRQIATHTKLLTAADLGTPSAGDGPVVRIAYASSEAEQAGLVDVQLDTLIGQGVARGDITLLSAYPLEQSCARLTRAYARRRLRVLDVELGGAWPCSETTFSTITAFKGLENRFILLLDVHAVDESRRDVNLLYVAMSRARAGLWMGVDSQLEPRIEAIARTNFSQVLGDGALSRCESAEMGERQPLSDQTGESASC